MTRTADYGRAWRKKEKRWLEARGEKVFSPPDREQSLLSKYNIKRNFLHDGGRSLLPHQRKSLFRDIIRFDLEQLQYQTKYAIFYITEYSPGTISELTWCFMNQIPAYVVTRKKLKAWPEACATKIFSSFEELHGFLNWCMFAKHIKLHKELLGGRSKNAKYRT